MDILLWIFRGCARLWSDVEAFYPSSLFEISHFEITDECLYLGLQSVRMSAITPSILCSPCAGLSSSTPSGVIYLPTQDRGLPSHKPLPVPLAKHTTSGSQERCICQGRSWEAIMVLSVADSWAHALAMYMPLYSPSSWYNDAMNERAAGPGRPPSSRTNGTRPSTG